MSLPAPLGGPASAPGDADPAPSHVAARVSQQLLADCARVAKLTQRRIAGSQLLYMAMLGLLFFIGVSAFVMAIIKGATTTDAATTGVFGGLSALTFVGLFISQPLKKMAALGMQNAWLLSIVNTYWTKLAYLGNAATAVNELEDAQHTLDIHMILYAKETGVGRIPGTKVSKGQPKNAGPPASETAQSAQPAAAAKGADPRP